MIVGEGRIMNEAGRSPLLIIAYVALAGAILAFAFGAGLFWAAGLASMAVLLAGGEILVRFRRS